jgi:hypothetical protein
VRPTKTSPVNRRGEEKIQAFLRGSLAIAVELGAA